MAISPVSPQSSYGSPEALRWAQHTINITPTDTTICMVRDHSLAANSQRENSARRSSFSKKAIVSVPVLNGLLHEALNPTPSSPREITSPKKITTALAAGRTVSGRKMSVNVARDSLQIAKNQNESGCGLGNALQMTPSSSNQSTPYSSSQETPCASNQGTPYSPLIMLHIQPLAAYSSSDESLFSIEDV